MKKRIVLILTCLLLVSTLLIPVSAARNPVVDNASLFSETELTALQEKAVEVSGNHQMEVVILTVNSLDGKTPQNYADDYYDENGYGYGDNKSGVLFLIAMDTRDWYVSTCGDAIYALTDYGIEQIFSNMSGYLSSGNYYLAFNVYLNSLPAYFEAYENGTPIDGYAGNYYGPGSYSPGIAEEILHYQPQKEPNHLKIVLISVGIGAVVALIVILIMRSGMKTAKRQYSAGNYLINDSFHLEIHRDVYLYSNVTRTRRESSNSSGGGGSSVHRSSGGTRHGGGGGKF